MDSIEIKLEDYHYNLPEHRIAQYPLPMRDASKLLVCQNNTISHRRFTDLGTVLPENSTLVFNDTKVIPARLIFKKPTGAVIEIFLLHPLEPSSDLASTMKATGHASWFCMIGNQKRWKDNQPLELTLTVEEVTINLVATKINTQQVGLSWDPPNIPFVKLIQSAGQVPLPPYMRRGPEFQDRSRYQTVYSKAYGAVAAPTAGLHFSDTLLKQLEYQGVTKEYITLHVGAGTFQPIKTNTVKDHPMHGEQLSVSIENLNRLLTSSCLVAVGTTSLRALESLFWYGVILTNNLGEDFHVEKMAPYKAYGQIPDFKSALKKVKNHMEQRQIKELTGFTEIFIFPPYKVRSCQGLITNFHLPCSTLILLVAAFIGDQWRKVYQEALSEGYRFLSYGDSSLLIPSNQR